MNNFEKIKACRSVASKEQTNDSLKNQDKNFNEKFTQEKEQIIIDGEKEYCKILFRCKHIDDLKSYIMICNGTKITSENAPIGDSELILIENTDSPFGFSFLCKRNNKEDVWEYSEFGHSGACSIVTALLKQLDCKTKECEELKEKYKNVLDLAKQNADANEYCLQELEQENYRYSKTLEEIEEIVKKATELPCVFSCDCNNCAEKPTKNWDTCIQGAIYKIVDIIKKVKN